MLSRWENRIERVTEAFLVLCAAEHPSAEASG